MEKTCCKFNTEGVKVEVYETDDGYRVDVKGDKEKIHELKKSCCGGSSFKLSCCE